MSELNGDYGALVLALTLAITAPDEQRAAQCVELADLLAANLTPDQVAAAQAEASAAATLHDAGADDE